MKPSLLCFVLSIIIFCCSSSLVRSQDSCSRKLDDTTLNIPLDISSLRCVLVWPDHNIIFRYARVSDETINFVCSFPSEIGAYVALGFSKDGAMVGSDGHVGWIDGGKLKTLIYSLNGKTPNQVTPSDPDPDLVPLDPNSRTAAYLWNIGPVDATPYLLFAIGPPNSFPSAHNYLLTKHRDYISLKINYDTGKVTLVSSSMLRRSHGCLNMIGWSLLMMIGAIVARYCNQWDPLWFYLHASIQTLAFLAGVIGTICRYVLNQRVHLTHHKNIGILILILGCLQVMAFVLRPRKQSSLLRKYWNYYHHNVGRILLIFALVNSFYGLSLGGEGSTWFAGYGVTVAFLVVVAIILEIRMRIQSKREAKIGQRQSQELDLY